MEPIAVTKKIEIKDLFSIHDYRLLLSANIISRFGDSVDGIAYAWMVYLLTGSRLLLGTLFAVNALPNILFGPFAGVFADRYDKKKLILFGYIGRGLTVSFTAFLFAMGLLHPWHLFVLTIVNSSLETVTMPAVVSLLPSILKPEELLSANGFSTSAYRFAELVGTATAGIIIATLGIAGAILLDGATFFAAAIILFSLSVKHIPPTVSVFGIRGYIVDLMKAFSFIQKQPLIKIALFLFAVVNFCLAPVNVLMPVFAKDVLRGGAEALSGLGISFLSGVIVGGLLVSQYGSRFKSRTMIIGGMSLFGLFYGLLCLPGQIFSPGLISYLCAFICFFFMGVLIPIANTPIQVFIMRNTEKSMMGRVGSFMTMISCIAIPLGAALTGLISEFISISMIFFSMGAIIMLVTVSLCKNKEFFNME